MKFLVCVFIIGSWFFCTITWGQKESRTIIGYVHGEISNDSIYFNSLNLDSGYFEQTHFAAKVVHGKFILHANLTYPQMYSTVFLSDAGKRIGRPGLCFIDPTTSAIHVNYISPECSTVNGNAGREFSEKFLPFLFKKKGYKCQEKDYEDARWSTNPELDSAMYEYVCDNRDSYVALWCLAHRFWYCGETEIGKNTLSRFSDKIKATKVWKLLDEKFRSALVKQNEKFPKLNLQDTGFHTTKFELKMGQKYTLVDFWFSRCKPCLAQIPEFKRLYDQYGSKGFNLISITTDKQGDFPLWKERIASLNMNWKQYLDAGAKVARSIPIIAFPTNFLLDTHGIVIMKDISLHALAEKLKAEL